MFVFRCVPVLRLIGIILLCGSVVRAESWKTEISSLLNNHCNDCHAGKDAEAGIDLVSLSDRLEDAQVMQQWGSPLRLLYRSFSDFVMMLS